MFREKIIKKMSVSISDSQIGVFECPPFCFKSRTVVGVSFRHCPGCTFNVYSKILPDTKEKTHESISICITGRRLRGHNVGF